MTENKQPNAVLSATPEYDPNLDINYFHQLNEYKNFKRSVPLVQLTTTIPSEKRWTYYQLGDTSIEPLIILPDLCTTAESFFFQLSELSARGFHVISVNIPPCFTHDEFILAFDDFLDKLNRVAKIVHLFGCGVGGLLAQSYSEKHSTRVGSLVLSNSFSDTTPLSDVSPFMDFYQLIPGPLLRIKILKFFNFDHVTDDMIMFATEYQVNQVDSLSQRQLASRLALLCHNKIIDHAVIEIPDEKITIIDTMDGSIYPRKMIDRLHEIYPRSRHAVLKTGGTAPYLSRSDEVNIYLLVHLRNVCGLNLPVYPDQPEEEVQTPSVEQEQVLVSWNQE